MKASELILMLFLGNVLKIYIKSCNQHQFYTVRKKIRIYETHTCENLKIIIKT